MRSRGWILTALFLHLALTWLVWRDLDRRTDHQVRGSKRLWRIASAANTSGQVAYLLLGRRSASHPA